MTPKDTVAGLPNGARASAQLTLGFEVAALQLTPFFKLGSLQLKPLSNVVSLHLTTGQPTANPLAAAISFQIERVELNESAHLKVLHLKPLGESREMPAPMANLQVDRLTLAARSGDAPISVTTSAGARTVVQLLGTFAIAAINFTPSFEIGSLRLDATSNRVMLRVAPSMRPTGMDLPPTFEIAELQLDDSAQIAGARVVPSVTKAN